MAGVAMLVLLSQPVIRKLLNSSKPSHFISHLFCIVTILKNDRQKYYRALDKADRGNTSEIEKLIAQSVERSMNLYLKVIKSGDSAIEKLVPLSALTKKSSFSEKYLNLLVRTGKLEAHKEGRIWLSSQKALDSYMKTRERKRSVKKDDPKTKKASH